ncbi:MAG TPA: hypothetical protein VII00_08685 [bacterium]
MLRLKQFFLLLFLGWLAVVLEVGLLNGLTANKRIIELLLIVIFYAILFCDFFPGIFLVISLSYIRDIFTGSYVGTNIVVGLTIFGFLQLIHNKLNENGKFFQVIFTFLAMITWHLAMKFILGLWDGLILIILKSVLNSLFAPFIYAKLRGIDDIILERQKGI